MSGEGEYFLEEECLRARYGGGKKMVKKREVAAPTILVAKLGMNGLGPWMLFSCDEDMSGLLAEIKDLREDVMANGDELTIRYARIPKKEFDEAGEFPGW